MNVFLSYARKDGFLAKQITSALLENGLEVWNAETEILPGDNFAEKISDALKNSDAMVILVSPDSLLSQNVQWEIGYALGDQSYANRVIPVLVGSEENFSADGIPWILRRLKTIRVPKPEQADEQINQITEALKLAA